MVRDRLNDRFFEWVPATMEANYWQYAVTVADVVEWDGLQLDGWGPRDAAAPSQ